MSQTEYNPKPSIWYAGVECFYVGSHETTDTAQLEIDYWKKLGYKACCLHENNQHQLYVSKEKWR
jgi:hypothetical protein